ncbi:DUF4073 domain-containing protein [Nesterenkonia sp. MY13]|uniref:DUF4073 domain-containing protein n=1 Tax=Nesterenkonia sedimenti TaxID=1463632 RepID=A0A7X8TH47_9MICC|nr:DUF4073 domain-containing protein [Nesterenkonia sedimenti]NLS08586.1 DUF4073 domain-containing protein [Nesterenkonia sedimenti]
MLGSSLTLALGLTACGGGDGGNGGDTEHWRDATSVEDGGGMEQRIEDAQAEGTFNAMGLYEDWASYGALLDAFSDIQGDPEDLSEALPIYREMAPHADGLLMAGDIVDTGAQWEWYEIYEVMEEHAEILPPQLVAAIGNHERYAPGGFEANRDRFLTFAERDEVWGEYVLEGPGGDLPVIVFGQDAAGPTEVPMSTEQVQFILDRLQYWTEQDSQVILMNHYPLGDTISGSWLPWYPGQHQHNELLTEALANYPNAILLAGHVHYPPELGDWAVQRRTETGHPDGFWAVSTLSMHNGWDAEGENTEDVTEIVTGDINQGLTLDSYGDRVVIRSYDFHQGGEQIREITVPNPLVPYEADLLAAQPEPTEEAAETPSSEPAEAPTQEASEEDSGPLAATGATPGLLALGALALLALAAGAVSLRYARRRS